MATALTVTGTSWITPALKRIHFASDDLSAFAESAHTDRYVKIVFPKPGVVYPEPLDVRALRGTIPPEDMPDVRTYTVVALDLPAGTLAIDFVVHGDEGVAGPWAASASVGDELIVNGPGGAYAPNPDADWHLLVGDESAIPAIGAAVDALPADAVARVILLVEKPGYEPALALPENSTALFVYRSDGAEDGALTSAVAGLDWPEGRVHAFVHGEAQEVMHGIRPLLLKERGLSRDQVSISGYWRRGRTEDSFRVWKSELAAAEG